MKHILWMCCMLLCSLQATATPPPDAVLTGIIKDALGANVPGAIIQIPDLRIGTVTDSTGSYRITGFPQGRYLVQVSSISFASKTSTINIGDHTTQDFILTESVIEQQEIVVTGQSKATEIRRSPVPLVAINSQYLKENLSTNAIDAIAKVPGITTVTTGPNVSKPFIRGLGFNRVLTLYNSMRHEGQQWGDEHGIEVDQYNIDRIEVVKGPASLTYGSDALAGVVNLLPTPVAPAGKIIGSATAEYQSNNGLLGGSLFASGNKSNISWTGEFRTSKPLIIRTVLMVMYMVPVIMKRMLLPASASQAAKDLRILTLPCLMTARQYLTAAATRFQDDLRGRLQRQIPHVK